MSYQPFLIANFATGLDKEVQPWLLPNDAFTELFDGFVYRGVAQIRNGYSGFATGFKSIAVESRMVHSETQSMTGAIDAANKTFTAILMTPIRKGLVIANGSNPVQTAQDDGAGGFTGDVDTGLSSINYTTGAVTIVWNAAPALASTVTITADSYPGNPVMGVMNFYPDTNVEELIVGDTQYLNKYVPATDRLVDITPAMTTYGGDSKSFWSSVNYPSATSVPRLLMVNGVVGDVIQQWDGTTVTDYSFTPAGTFTTLNGRQIFEIQDRLVVFQTIEDGVLYPRRIRISGFGQECDNFSNTAPGAGFIDIPDNSWFYGADKNRNDVIIFTELSVWIMKYTGNDVVPFQLFQIDGSRGSKAWFSAISYLNRTIAISPRGLIEVDGYNVERMDNNIPQFTFNEVQDGEFEHVFCGFLDEERDVYLMYPSTSWDGDVSVVPEGSSDRILVINFEEDNFCQYRLPLSCMGSFKETDVITWNDLTEANGYPNWDALAAKFGSWNAFPFNIGAPIGIGGGHKGEVWELNTDESEDNVLNILDISVSGLDVTVTTQWNNYQVGDMIFFTAIDGITGLNDTQARIISIDTAYQTFTVRTQTPVGGAYVSGGEVCRVIPFVATTKTLNPFINIDKKLKIGWLYLYVETTETWLLDASGNPVPALLTVEVFTDDKQDPNHTNPTFSYDIDCTNPPGQQGVKKWVKIWINQVAKFIQLKFTNEQAGANMKIHAIMPGMAAIGRLV
jgi:hypothetical protein